MCFGTQKGEIPKLEQKEDLEISVQFNLKFQDKLLLLLLESDTNIWQAFFVQVVRPGVPSSLYYTVFHLLRDWGKNAQIFEKKALLRLVI